MRNSATLALARAAAGLPVDGAALPPRVASAVAVATELGAPLVPVLEAALQVEAERRDLLRAVEVATAEGRAVARGLVLAPPIVGPLTAVLVTDAPLAVWATPVGRMVLALAVGLWILGAAVVQWMVRRALTPDPAQAREAERLELAAVAAAAGLAAPAAIRVASEATDGDEAAGRIALWLELGAVGPPPSDWADVGARLAAARHEGLAVAPLLRAMGRGVREEQHHLAMQRAARLGARLTVPTTLLLLPAAGLVVAAPLVHGLVSTLS